MNGVIKWVTEHPVAANLAMIFVLVAGLLSVFAVPQTTFPEFTLDEIEVEVEYVGASPTEITQSIIQPIEDQLAGVEGVDEMTATASEGRGSVKIILLLGEDVNAKLDEVKAEIDRIEVFPQEADEPVVTRSTQRMQVLEIAVHGNVPEAALKRQAERLKDELVRLETVSFAEVSNTRDYEISIEVERDVLRAYGLTLQDIGRIVSNNSLELPGGAIDTDTLSIPIRTLGRNYNQSDFEEIIILTGDNGAQVRLGEIATVIDRFDHDNDLSARFGGEANATVTVFRVGDERVLAIVEEVKAFLAENFVPSLPIGINVTIWENDAENLQSRLNLLMENAILGGVLVILCLALFLDFRLAFWSAVGIGIAFIAAFGVMYLMDMSINMISLFGFILAIGIIVDNAIVVGENVYKNAERGLPPMRAAVAGTQRVAVPVIFSALTTIVAFTPLLQLPGTLGKFLGDIPKIVIIVLSLSLLQSLLILPRHLSHMDVSENYRPNIVLRALRAIRGFVDRGLKWFINVPLDRMLRFATRRFLVPIGSVIALMILTIGLLVHGYVKFSFFPSIDDKFVTADVELTDGTTVARTEEIVEILRQAAVRAGDKIQAELPVSHAPVLEDINITVGKSAGSGGPNPVPPRMGSSVAHVVVRLLDPEQRTFPTAHYEALWRAEIGKLPGVKRLTFNSALVNAGDPVALELSLPDGQDIQPVVTEIREGLNGIAGVFDIRDDLSAGRVEYKLQLKDEARIYGLQLSDLAQQMRNGFFGYEATRVQRGQDDVRVFVRLPEEQRDTLADVLAMDIRTSQGDLIPLGVVATITEGLSQTEILRRGGRTITTVTADVDSAIATGQEVNDYIVAEILPALKARYDGLIVDFGGEQRTQGDAQGALMSALGLALFVIFALLALVFRSYLQPIVVMLAIPLGLIGAVAGHLIMGLQITLISIFGIIGLAGVIINNSLVMIDLFNECLDRGMDTQTAVVEGSKDRFRPILLTSLTTFLGIFPLLMETSLQAQFLVPLAVSIGFGVLFGTVIVVFSIPAFFIAQARIFSTFRKESVAPKAETVAQPEKPTTLKIVDQTALAAE